MRSLWLLPDINQSGSIQALEKSTIKPLNESLNVINIPKFITLGIPEELIRNKLDFDAFIYGQFFRGEGSQDSIFVCSCPAQKDISGRVTFITNIQLINYGENIQYPPVNDTDNIDHNQSINHLIAMAVDPKNKHSQNIKNMLEKTSENYGIQSFTSEYLKLTSNKPQWMPLKKKWINSKKYLIILLLIIVVAAIIKFTLRH